MRRCLPHGHVSALKDTAPLSANLRFVGAASKEQTHFTAQERGPRNATECSESGRPREREWRKAHVSPPAPSAARRDTHADHGRPPSARTFSSRPRGPHGGTAGRTRHRGPQRRHPRAKAAAPAVPAGTGRGKRGLPVLTPELVLLLLQKCVPEKK